MKTVPVNSLWEFGTDLSRRLLTLEWGIIGAGNLLAKTVLERVKEMTPISDISHTSGSMKRKARVLRVSQGKGKTVVSVGWSATDFSGTFYPPYVDLGTGVHAHGKSGGWGRGVIKPKTSPFLHYEWAGGWVSTKTVRGQKAQLILQRAVRSVAPAVHLLVKKAVGRM
jgi:hypothetical protein